MPREVVRDPHHDRRVSLGWLAVAWMEHFCVHGPGDVEGQPVNLDDELAEITADTYAVSGSGRRLYDSVFISRPKGRDKSGHAGRLVLFEALGPCRFSRWAEGGEVYRFGDFTYVFEEGEPIGAPIVHPVIRCLATEELQAGNTYDNVYYNLTEGALSEFMLPNGAGLTRTILPDGGEIIPSSASNSSKDGGKETFVVFDETHLYNTPELRKMYATVRRNCGKRKAASPWSLETSTMYRPGESSVAERTYQTAEKIREGKTKASRLLFDHREAPADVDLSDEVQLRAALNEVYGPFAGVMDLERIINEIFDPRNSPEDSRRFWLNQRTAASDSWLSEPEINAVVARDKVVAPGETITLGFDGSRSRKRGVTDATSLMGCRLSDGHLFELGIWEQPEGPYGDGWAVPTGQVDAAVRDAFETYNVVAFYADPAKWETYVAAWEASFSSKLKVTATSKDHPIEWWMTGGRSGLIVRITEQLHTAIVEREVTIDGAAATVRHLTNARVRTSRSGDQIAKEHPDSARKIDAAVTCILAFAARMDALAAGVTDESTKKHPAVFGF